MNIIEAISNSLTEVTKLSDYYIARIYADGTVNCHIPVDIRVNRINIPLRRSDISFIYDTTTKEERIHKVDAKLDTYYPIGSKITLTDGGVFEIISYGPIKQYNNTTYVDIFCSLESSGCYLVETINNNQIESKVIHEMNNIIESNEIIKSLLPQYNYNWLKFSDDDIDAIEKFNAMNVLSVFNSLEYKERYNIMTNINSSLSQKYTTLPLSITNEMKLISDISISPLIKAGFMEYHSEYNARYVFEGLIYIYENMLLTDESLYDEFYLVNKLGQKCKIKIEKNNSIIIFKFVMPDECKYDYILEVYNWKTYGSYIKYSIDKIKLYSVSKDGFERNEITNVSTDQGDYLKVCTEIFRILSASNYEDMTLSEYYDSIDTLLNNINTKNIMEEEE